MVINATDMFNPKTSGPSSRFIDFSMLTSPMRVPIIPKAGAKAAPLS